jgi:tetratricopeptide (TPR) repeat protein/tRNA A-37 threonylcarbamoyl transferase component Bud32
MQQGPSGETRPAVAELTGTIAGRFVIVKLLGAGGMGQVYQAQDTKLKRVVAIKRMAPGLQKNENDRRRFLREAQQASALNHPNIAGIYDVLEEQGEIFLIMEYVEGTPLRAVLQGQKNFSNEEFFNVAIQGVEGLNAAHEKGILHGDIKPENLMLTREGRVKVLDFGVARRFTLGTNNEATLTLATLSGVVSGTPAYMAPEVLMQKPYDGRADLFSMGLVCYEMLGGRQPFETDSMAGTLASVLHTEPPPIEEINPKVSPSVSNMLRTMMEKDPAQRYSTARDVLVDLRRVQEGEDPVFARAASGRKKKEAAGTRFSAKGKLLGAVAAAVVVVVVGAIFLVNALRHNFPQGKLRPAQSTGEQATTLVVLPFDQASDDAKLNAFGDGLVDTLTAKLAQLSGSHPVQVVSAGEVRQRNISNLAEARQEFGANAGLHLGLQRSGELVRVTYSLTDASSGKVIKAGASDVPLTDPFAIEDDVTKAVAAALGFSLKADESRELAFHGTSMPEAYNYYTQARGYLEDASKAANVDSAIILLGQALKADQNYGRAEAELGSAYWAKYAASKDKSLIAKSRQACSKAIDLGNAGAAGHVCLGVIESGTGKYEDAVKQFQSAVELEPSNEDAYIGLGGAYEGLGKAPEAENTYKKIIALRSNYWLGYNQLGAFYLRQAQYDDASKMFSKVVALTPESFRGYANLGATLLYEAKYADAIKPLEQSLAIHATADTYSNLGTAYYYQHRFRDSAQAYEKAVQLNDKDYTNWGNLGEAYYLDGERPKARSAFERGIALAKSGLAINNRDPDVLNALAKYSAMVDNRTDALAYLGRAVEQSKSDKDSLFDAATIYNRLGDKGLALEWLSKAVRAGYSPEMIRQQPDLDNLHGDSRFEDLLKSSSSGTNPAK